jgi:DNA-binding NtrC family response regulator
LRVIQTHKFERLGGEETLKVDVRILAATNKDLFQEVKKGHFREDLFYRLNVIPIHLPSLRNRVNDIPLLAKHFLRGFCIDQGKDVRGFSSEAMRMLLNHTWPGNVRELENSIEHAVVLTKGAWIEVSDLPAFLTSASTIASTKSGGTIQENEKKLLLDILDECYWNKKKAALRLGISRSTLYNKLKKYQIGRPRPI